MGLPQSLISFPEAAFLLVSTKDPADRKCTRALETRLGLPCKLVEAANMADNRGELFWQFHSRVTHVQGEESRLISWTKDASKYRFKWRKRSIIFKSWGKGWNTDYSNHQNTVRKKGKIVQQNSFEMIDLCLWILQPPLVSKKLHTAKLPACRKELLVFPC